MKQTPEYYKEHLDDLVIRTSCAEEQETVIVIPRKGTIRLSTSDNTMLTKVRRLLKDPGTDWRLVDVSRSANESDPRLISEIAIETDKKLVRLSPMKRTREPAEEPEADVSEPSCETETQDLPC